MAQLTVGLDLGNEALKRVRLQSSFRSVEVLDFDEVPLPTDDRPHQERLAEAVQNLTASNGKTALVATALPGNVVSVRTLQLPFSDNKRISQTIGFELESQIPFSLDQIVFDYIKLVKTPDGGVRLLAAFCQIDQMRRWLDTIQAAGMDPRLVGADCLAYGSLSEFLPPPEEKGDRFAIVDIGHSLTSVCVLGPDGVEFGRTLSGGGNDATLKLAEAFKLDPEKAEHGKRRGGFVETEGWSANDPEQVMVSDAIRQPLDVLARELRQTLASHRTLSGSSVEKIWLCGGGSAITNLDGYLTDQLDLPAERLKAEHFNLEGVDELPVMESEAIAWPKALGLALHAHLGGRRNWLNLRRGPFAFKGDFAAVRGKVLHVAMALMILVFLAIGNALVGYFSMRSTEKTLDKRIRDTTKAILGKAYDNIDVAQSIIREKLDPEADPLPRATAVDGLRDFHDRIPTDLPLRLRDVNISPTRIRIEGFTDGFQSVDKIKAALEKHECFKQVQVGKPRKTKDESEVEFELTIVNGC